MPLIYWFFLVAGIADELLRQLHRLEQGGKLSSNLLSEISQIKQIIAAGRADLESLNTDYGSHYSANMINEKVFKQQNERINNCIKQTQEQLELIPISSKKAYSIKAYIRTILNYLTADYISPDPYKKIKDVKQQLQTIKRSHEIQQKDEDNQLNSETVSFLLK